jgi:F0F1-type ATP synthase delta subunit
MTKIVFSVLAQFAENASKSVFAQIFGSPSVGNHLFAKFSDSKRDVLAFISLLDIENTRLLYAYLDELTGEAIKHNHFKNAAIQAAYERDEKERAAVLAALQDEANRALELQKAFEMLPPKARKIINQ